MAAVPDHYVSDIAHPFAVDENSADSDGRSFPRAMSGQFQHIAILQDKTILRGHADILREPPVFYQMTVFTMNGNEVAGPGQLKHRFKFFLAGMARHVNLRNLLIMNFRAAAVEMIDEVGNRFFVAGNKFGRENDRVSRLDLNGFVVVQRDPVKHRQRFPLASCGQESQLAGRQIVPTFVLGHKVSRQVQISQLGSDLAVSDHAATTENYAPAAALRNIDDLLNPRNTGRKRRNQNLACALLNDLLEISSNFPFRGRIARPFHVGGIREQQEHSLFAVGGKALKIEHLAFHGRVVDFEVTGMDHCSDWGLDSQCQAVHQAMGYTNPFDLKRSDFPRLAGGDFADVRVVVEVMLFELVVEQAKRQARAEDRYGQMFQDVRQGSNMVLVGVSENDGFELVLMFQQIAYVGDYQVDP